MEIKVTKADGAGNSFVIIYDNNNHELITNSDFIQKICSQEFGFNTDGMLLLSPYKNSPSI